MYSNTPTTLVFPFSNSLLESILSLWRPSDLGASLCQGPLCMHLYPVNELIFTTTFGRSASALISLPSDYAHRFRQLAWECLQLRTMPMRQRIDPSRLIPSTIPSHTPPAISSQQSNSPFFPTSVMSGSSGSSHLQELVEAALEDYKQQTGIDLAKHTLAGRLQDCKSVDDVTAVLREQTQGFKKFREKDKVLKPLKRVLTILHLLSSVPLSSVPRIAHHVHPVRSEALADVQYL